MCISKESLQRRQNEYASNISSLSKSLKNAEKDLEKLKKEKSYYEEQCEKRMKKIVNKQKQIMDQSFELKRANESISKLKREVTVYEILTKSGGEV